MNYYEVNFDGMPGPTHHYGGLSKGNVASMESAEIVANPREAALQALKKMQLLHQLGLIQGVLPPHPRPAIRLLRSLGFRGSSSAILNEAARTAPALLSACSSSSNMWAANSATVSPSMDSQDGRLHFTPANLVSNLHRAQETAHTARLLKEIFPGSFFRHHPSLPATATLSDEGSANYTRLSATHAGPGVELFVFGRKAFDPSALTPTRFPARQTAEASQSIARRHRLQPNKVVFAQQNPVAIDAGVFHNDVIAVGNGPFFLYHEQAFVDTSRVIRDLKNAAAACGFTLELFEVKASQLSLEMAVRTYFFNAQIVTLPSGKMAMLAPQECFEHSETERLLKALPMDCIYRVDLNQSMRNGGGPACVRLRVVLSEKELRSTKTSVLLTEALYEKLVSCVKRYYRDRLTTQDLADPELWRESQQALAEIYALLDLSLSQTA